MLQSSDMIYLHQSTHGSSRCVDWRVTLVQLAAMVMYVLVLRSNSQATHSGAVAFVTFFEAMPILPDKYFCESLQPVAKLLRHAYTSHHT